MATGADGHLSELEKVAVPSGKALHQQWEESGHYIDRERRVARSKIAGTFDNFVDHKIVKTGQLSITEASPAAPDATDMRAPTMPARQRQRSASLNPRAPKRKSDATHKRVKTDERQTMIDSAMAEAAVAVSSAFATLAAKKSATVSGTVAKSSNPTASSSTDVPAAKRPARSRSL